MKKLLLITALILVFGLIIAQNAIGTTQGVPSTKRGYLVTDTSIQTTDLFQRLNSNETGRIDASPTTRNATPLPYIPALGTTQFIEAIGWTSSFPGGTGNDFGWGGVPGIGMMSIGNPHQGIISLTSPLIGPITASTFLDFRFSIGWWDEDGGGDYYWVDEFYPGEYFRVQIATETNPTQFTTLKEWNEDDGEFTETQWLPIQSFSLSQYAGQNIHVRYELGGPWYDLLAFIADMSVTNVSATAELVVTPEYANSFGSVTVGAASAPQVFSLTNSGTNPLTINSINITGANSGDFTYTVTPGIADPITVASDPILVSVQFAPTSAGLKQANLTITHTATGSPFNVLISGTGIVLPPGVLQIGFGEIPVISPVFVGFHYSYSQTIYLQEEINTEGKALTKIAWEWDGGGSYPREKAVEVYLGHYDGYEIPDISWNGLSTLIPTDIYTKVYDGPIYLPDSRQWVELTLDIPFVYSNEQNLVVSVLQKVPGVTVGQSDGQFMSTPTTNGLNRTETRFRIQQPIYFDQLEEEWHPFYWDAWGYIPGFASTPNVRFTFEDPSPNPVFSISPPSYDFHKILKDQSSAPREFTIRNVGLGTLNVSNITITGTNASEFRIAQTLTESALGYLEAGTFTVVFEPTSFGEKTAFITITDNATGSPRSFPITGSCHDVHVSNLGQSSNTQFQILPVHANWDQSYSQMIYLNSEIRAEGTITDLSFQYNGHPSWSSINRWEIYLAHTTESSIATNFGWLPSNSFTKVFEGLVSGNIPDGWFIITLDTPFEYDASQNLAIAVNRIGTENGWANGPAFYNYNTPAMRGMHVSMDGADPFSHANPPTSISGGGFTRTPDLPVMRLYMEDYVLAPVFSSSPPSHNFGMRPLNTRTNQTFNISNAGFGTLNVTAANITGDAAFQLWNAATLGLPHALGEDQSFEIIISYLPLTEGNKTATLNVTANGVVHNIPLSGSVGGEIPNFVEIGTGTALNFGGNTGALPILGWYYGDTFSQSLYYNYEIGKTSPTQITSISFHYNGATYADSYSLSLWDVYIGHTTATSLNAWTPVENHTLVHTGTIGDFPTSPSWLEIVLQAPFAYDGASNLVVSVHRRRPGSVNHFSSGMAFYMTAAAGRSWSHGYDSGNYTVPPPGITGWAVSGFPNMRFSFPVLDPEPIFTVNPEEHNFGTIDIGHRLQRNFAVSNAGDLPLTLTNISITGANAADFAFEHGMTMPYIVVGGETFNINVTFRPLSAGNKTANLLITDDISGRVINTIPLEGIAVDATLLTADMPFLETFPTTQFIQGWGRIVESTQTTAAVDITSTGAPVYSAPNHLRLFNSTDADANLIAYTSYIQGMAGNYISFYARSPQEGTTVIIGSITDIYNPASFTPITEIELTDTYTKYYVDMATATGLRIAFKHGLGATNRTIFIDDIEIDARPLQPAFSISPGSHDFGIVNILEIYQTSFEVRNLGAPGLQITDMMIMGNNNNEITITSPTSSPAIGFLQTFDIDIEFAPLVGGNKAITIVVLGPNGVIHHRINITATTHAGPVFAMTPEGDQHFGIVLMDQISQPMEFIISNVGALLLDVNNIEIVGENAHMFSVIFPTRATVRGEDVAERANTSHANSERINAFPTMRNDVMASLAFLEEFYFAVEFAPTYYGDVYTTLRVTHSTNQVYEIQLEGQCYAYGISDDETDFQVGFGTALALPPIHQWYNTSYGQVIYHADQLQGEARVRGIQIHWDGTNTGSSENWRNWEVYLAHTTRNDFPATVSTNWVDTRTFTQVYAGTLVLPPSAGWINIPFTTPFDYDGVQNLVIAVHKQGAWQSMSSSGMFQSTAAPTNRSMTIYRDTPNNFYAEMSTNFSDGSVPGAVYASFPNIIFTMNLLAPLPVDPTFAVSPIEHNFGVYAVTAPALTQIFSITNAGSNPLTINAINITGQNPEAFTLENLFDGTLPVDVLGGSTIQVRVSFMSDILGHKSANLVITDNLSRAVHTIPLYGIVEDSRITDFPYYEGFEGTLFPPFGWTLADVDNDGTNWIRLGRDFPTYGDVVISGNASVASFSWLGGATFNANNWLISPQFILPTLPDPELAHSLSWAALSTYQTERYSVYVSTATNAVADFTNQIFTEQLEATAGISQRVVSLKAFEGQPIYIAFRHHDNDKEVIVIDDIAITLGFAPGSQILSNPPRNVAATGGVNQINVTWTPPAIGIPTAYHVYRNGINVSSLVYATSYIDNNAVAGVTYEYRVSGVYINPNGETVLSDIATGTATAAEEMFPPINLTATATNNNVTLNWQQSAITPGWFTHAVGNSIGNSIGTGGAVTFAVAQRFTPMMLAEMGVAGANLTTIGYMGNVANATYSLRIWQGGQGSPQLTPGALMYSQDISGNTTVGQWRDIVLNTPFPIPTTQELWIGYQVTTTTGHPAAADSGPVFDGFGNLMFFNNVWSTALELVPTFTQNFMIRGYASTPSGPVMVQSINNSDYSYESNNSSRISNLTIAEPLQIRRNLYPNEENSRDSRAFVGYNVYRNGVIQTTVPISTLTYTQNNLPSDLYNYQVKAVYTAGESIPAETSIKIGINPPVNLVATAGNSAVDLQWTAPSYQGITLLGYRVYRDGNLITPIITANTYHDSGLFFNINYNYNVTAVYTTTSPEVESAFSETAIATPYGDILYPPSNLTSSANYSEVALGWSPPSTYEGWFTYADNTAWTGLPQTYPWAYAAIRFTPEQLYDAQLSGGKLTRVGLRTNLNSANYNLIIWAGGSANPLTPGEVIYTQNLGSTTTGAWRDFNITIPVDIPYGQEMWIGLEITNNNNAGNFLMVNNNGTGTTGYSDLVLQPNMSSWGTLMEQWNAGGAPVNSNWWIRGYAESVTGQPIMIGYTGLENTEPYQSVDESLLSRQEVEFAEQDFSGYYSGSRALLGYNIYQNGVLVGHTNNHNYVYEATATGNHTFGITAVYSDGVESSMITRTQNVTSLDRYVNSFPFTENFDTLVLNGWRNRDADGDGQKWMRDGTSYSSLSTINTDNWLISPQIALRQTLEGESLLLKYEVAVSNEPMAMEILLSETGVDYEDFTQVLHQETITNTGWVEMHVPVAFYEGKTVYFAVRHTGNLNNGNFSINSLSVEYEISSPVYRIDPADGHNFGVVHLWEGARDEYTKTQEFTISNYSPIPMNVNRISFLTEHNDFANVDGFFSLANNQVRIVTMDNPLTFSITYAPQTNGSHSTYLFVSYVEEIDGGHAESQYTYVISGEAHSDAITNFPYNQEFSPEEPPAYWERFTGLLDDGNLNVYDGEWTGEDNWTIGAYEHNNTRNLLATARAHTFSIGAPVAAWLVTPPAYLGTPEGYDPDQDRTFTLSLDLAFTGSSNPEADLSGDLDRFAIVMMDANTRSVMQTLAIWDNLDGSENFQLNALTNIPQRFFLHLADFEGHYQIAFYLESKSNTDNVIHVANVTIDYTMPTPVYYGYAVEDTRVVLEWRNPYNYTVGRLVGYELTRNGIVIEELLLAEEEEDMHIYTDMQSIPNVVYNYEIRALYAIDNGILIAGPAHIRNVLIPLYNPVNNLAVVTVPVNSNSVRAIWDAPTPQIGEIVGYRAYLYQDDNEEPISEYLFTIDSEFVIDYVSIDTDTKYTFEVFVDYDFEMYQPIYEIRESQVATDWVVVPIFNPVTNLRYTPDSNEITLYWDAPVAQNYGTILGYKVYRDGVDLNMPLNPLTYFVDHGEHLVNFETYEYYIVAVYGGDIQGEAIPSETLVAIPRSIFVPSTIVNAEYYGDAYSGNVLVTWDIPAPSDEPDAILIGYVIYAVDIEDDRTVMTEADVVGRVTNPNTTEFRHEDVERDRKYFYHVAAEYTFLGVTTPSRTRWDDVFVPAFTPAVMTYIWSADRLVLNWTIAPQKFGYPVSIQLQRYNTNYYPGGSPELYVNLGGNVRTYNEVLSKDVSWTYVIAVNYDGENGEAFGTSADAVLETVIMETTSSIAVRFIEGDPVLSWTHEEMAALVGFAQIRSGDLRSPSRTGDRTSDRTSDRNGDFQSPNRTNSQTARTNERIFINAYHVYRNGIRITPQGGISTPEFQDRNTAANTTYTYGVTALYEAGESPEVNITVHTHPMPNVTNFVATYDAAANENQDSLFVRLTWNALNYSGPYIPTGVRIFRKIANLEDNMYTVIAERHPSDTQYNDYTVQADVQYHYQVRVVYATPIYYSPEESYTAALTSNIVTVPRFDAPRNVTAAANAALNGFVVTWQHPSPMPSYITLIDYQIFRDGEVVQTVSATTTTITDLDVTLDRNYVYGVRARYGGPVSYHSATVSAPAVFLPYFAPVTNVRATLVGNQVTINWTSPAQENLVINNITVRRNQTTQVGTINNNSAVDNLTAPGHYVYDVTVSYFNLTGATVSSPMALSNAVTYVTDSQFPEVTSFIAGFESEDYSAVVLEWTMPSIDPIVNVVGFEIYRNGAHIATRTAEDRTHIDRTVIADMIYDYGIAVLYNIAPREISPIVPINNFLVPLSRPVTNLVAFQSEEGHIHLNWNLPSDQSYGVRTEFVIYRNDIMNDVIFDTIQNGNATEYIDYGVNFPFVLNSSYSYEVVIIYHFDYVDINNVPGYIASIRVDSNAVQVTRHTPVTNLQAVLNANNNVVLTWNPPMNPLVPTQPQVTEGYRVYRNNNFVGLVAHGTNTFTESVPVDNIYTYQVIATYPTGNAAPATTEISLPIFNPVSNVLATFNATTGLVDLSWNPPATQNLGEIFEFIIRRDGNTDPHGYAAPSPGSFTDTEVELDKKYYYTVQVRWSGNIDGTSIEVRSNDVVVPIFSPVTELHAALNAAGHVVLTWTPPAHPVNSTLANFRISRNGNVIGNAAAGLTSYTDTNVAIDNLYTYAVDVVYTNPSGVSTAVHVPIIVPAFYPPSQLTGVEGDTEVTLNWVKPQVTQHSELLGFRIYRNTVAVQGIVEPTVFTFKDTGLSNYADYTYSVTAVYGSPSGESVHSASIVLKPVEDRLPVTELFAEQIGKDVLITWKAPDKNIRGFYIQRDGNLITPDFITEIAFIDRDVPIGDRTYAVYVQYQMGVSESVYYELPVVNDIDVYAIPEETTLHVNYPNPFNPETLIRFDMATSSNVTIDVYNIRGQRIKSLVNEFKDAGKHEVVWNGKDDNGRDVSSGMYLYIMKTNDHIQTRRMTLMK